MLSNTTNLYDDACARRAPSPDPMRSPTWKIPDKDGFLIDCASRRRRRDSNNNVCAWYHSMGMSVGERLVFRNGMVLHGTAPVGDDSLRVSLAVDCIVSTATRTFTVHLRAQADALTDSIVQSELSHLMRAKVEPICHTRES